MLHLLQMLQIIHTPGVENVPENFEPDYSELGSALPDDYRNITEKGTFQCTLKGCGKRALMRRNDLIQPLPLCRHHYLDFKARGQGKGLL